MKKTITILAAFIILFSLNSCLLTLYPIYTESDVVFKESLLGNFKKIKEDDDVSMIIQPLSNYKGDLPPAIKAISGKGYLATLKDAEQNVILESVVFAVQLGNGLYLDFLPLHPKNGDEYFESMRIPMHSVYRIKSLDARTGFVMQRFSSGFLSGLIEHNKIRISNENIDNQHVITASTQELQDYIRKYGHLEDAYETELETYSKK